MDRPSQALHQADTAQTTAHADAVVRLTPFGWSGGILVILALLTASFFAVGYFLVYWRNADMDFMVVYRALLLNDGQRFFFEHPAYFTILSAKLWFQMLHSLGLLDTASLSAVPSVSDAPAFDSAITSAIRAARVLTFLTATASVLVFALLTRFIARDGRVALLATFAFAFSGGIAVHLRTLRSELIAGCFFAFAVMILIIVARRATVWRPVAVAAAAALCALGLENKVHAVLLIAALPTLILPFGSVESASVDFWKNTSRAWILCVLAALTAVILVLAAMPLIALGLSPVITEKISFHPLLFGRFGMYQAGLLAWIGVCMLVFAKIWRVSFAETLASLFAVVIGASLALLALFISYDPSTVIVVLNPVEQMLTYADASAVTAVGSGGPLAILDLLFSGVLSVLRRYTFFLFSSPRPTVFLTWLIIPGIVYSWRRGERLVAVQAGVLMLSAIGIDALGIRRGLKAEYFILTDPLIIIAGMLLLDRLSEVRFRKWAYPIGVALVAIHVVISQAEPVKLALKRSGPESVCHWRPYDTPLLQLPWCEASAKRSSLRFIVA